MAAVTIFDPSELDEGMDPYSCVECLGLGDSCEFHVGFVAGWDACAALMASAIEADTIEVAF